MPAAEAILEKRASASPTSMASPSFRCPILSVLTKWADRVVRDGPSTIPADRRHPVLARAPRVYFWMVRLLTGDGLATATTAKSLPTPRAMRRLVGKVN